MESFFGKNIFLKPVFESSTVQYDHEFEANLVLQHISAVEAMARHASSSTACDLVKRVSHDLRVLFNNRHFDKKNFVGALAAVRFQNPYPALAQMARFHRSEVLGR